METIARILRSIQMLWPRLGLEKARPSLVSQPSHGFSATQTPCSPHLVHKRAGRFGIREPPSGPPLPTLIRGDALSLHEGLLSHSHMLTDIWLLGLSQQDGMRREPHLHGPSPKDPQPWSNEENLRQTQTEGLSTKYLVSTPQNYQGHERPRQKWSQTRGQWGDMTVTGSGSRKEAKQMKPKYRLELSNGLVPILTSWFDNCITPVEDGTIKGHEMGEGHVGTLWSSFATFL